MKFNEYFSPGLYIISFPKSGRTWLRVMLDDLGVEATYTHDGADAKPPRTRSGKWKYRNKHVVLLVRDPRDTVVSHFFHLTRRLNTFEGSIAEFIRSEAYGLTAIVDFQLYWFAGAANIPRLLLCSYEKLRADPADGLTEILRFAGRNLSDYVIRCVTSERTFEKMRALEAAGGFSDQYGGVLSPRDNSDSETFKVRRGKVGGFREYLSADDVAYCDRTLAEKNYWKSFALALQRFSTSTISSHQT
jgi:hypothetical protein